MIHWILFWVSVGFLIYVFLNLLTYTRYNRVLEKAREEKRNPLRSLSVLIPARNEEHNIED
ncbi:MAG TPA: glycosyl hydrolase, partial [Thermotogota bacterium]|nr:glycosyl hydrolase [Thermotogota bacterium]HPM22114.1 glycosyl hydrolase [Thermotogota bacterium]